ncbi:hypothetical protein Tco_1359855 [Tanacetum coccineum]
MPPSLRQKPQVTTSDVKNHNIDWLIIEKDFKYYKLESCQVRFVLNESVPDHQCSILTDSKVTSIPNTELANDKALLSPSLIVTVLMKDRLKIGGEETEVLSKNISKDAFVDIKLFKLTYQERYEHGMEKAVKSQGTLRKSLLPPRWRLLMAQIIQCLGEHKMEGYGNDGVTLNPTQVFSVHNWVLKKNKVNDFPSPHSGWLICSEDEPMEFKALTKPPLKVIRRLPWEIEYAEEEFNTFPDLSSSDDAKKEIKLEDLSKLMQNVCCDFMTLNSKLVKEREYAEAEAAWFKAQPLFPNHMSLPTELKELLPKFNDLSREIKELKKYVEKLEVEILGDLKEIPSKLEKFTSTVSSLTTQVVELKTLQWELPAKFLSIPGQVSSIQAKQNLIVSSKLLTSFGMACKVKEEKTDDDNIHDFFGTNRSLIISSVIGRCRVQR